MNFDEYRQQDAVGLGELVQEREVTAAELLELAIARAQARNDVINALVHPMFDTARASVRDTETALPAPLGGVPFLIKDLTAVMGEPCTSGSRLNADVVSPHDATIVTRYRRAGLTIFGKTTTPEFGLNVATETVLCGATRNPWDLTRVPGGSSGGAAAAVADGWLPAANASDGGGSIRIPASCCGLVGLKPSRGRCPSGPDVGEGWGGMSTAHVVCRSVRDSAAFLDATHGPVAGDPYCAPAFDGSFQSGLGAPLPRLRIAVEDKPLTGGVVHADCLAALQSAATLCRDLGHTVDAASPQFDRATYGAATGCIVASNVAATLKSRALALGIDAADAPIEKQTMAMAKFGATIDAATYVQAINTIHRTGRTLASFHDDWDIMLTPVLLAPPVRIGHLSYDLEDSELFGQRFTNFWGFTNLQNATGQPAISLPLFWNADGLPVGVQFVGPVGSELRLLQLAAELEQACPWSDRIPPDTTSNRSTAALDQQQSRGTNK